jgi:3-phenylpropionate/cinnamic acid dioxygenase small subunit
MPMEVTTVERQEVEQFLYREAWLLDNYRLREWFDLLTDDVRYLVPTIETVRGSQARYRDDVPYYHLVDWDKRIIDLRLRQIETGLNHCEIPASVVQRIVANVFVDGTDGDDALKAYSNVQATLVRHGVYDTVFKARREDKLRRLNGERKIAERKVELLLSYLPRTLPIFL